MFLNRFYFLAQLHTKVNSRLLKTQPNFYLNEKTFQRHATVTCPVDKMAADPDKQAAHTVTYLLSE